MVYHKKIVFFAKNTLEFTSFFVKFYLCFFCQILDYFCRLIIRKYLKKKTIHTNFRTVSCFSTSRVSSKKTNSTSIYIRVYFDNLSLGKWKIKILVSLNEKTKYQHCIRMHFPARQTANTIHDAHSKMSMGIQ